MKAVEKLSRVDRILDSSKLADVFGIDLGSAEPTHRQSDTGH
jgi:hypothetical protein